MKNIPNCLTLARFAMAPVLAVAMLASEQAAVAAGVFAIGMTTDFADGYLARSRGLATKLGALMDPIADKVFVGTAFVCLAATDVIPPWVVIVVFARDVLVTAMRLGARRRGTEISANSLGKAKTVIQTAVVFVLLVAGGGSVAAQGLVYLMVAVTVVSGAVYVARYRRGRRIVVSRVERRAGTAVDASASLG